MFLTCTMQQHYCFTLFYIAVLSAAHKRCTSKMIFFFSHLCRKFMIILIPAIFILLFFKWVNVLLPPTSRKPSWGRKLINMMLLNCWTTRAEQAKLMGEKLFKHRLNFRSKIWRENDLFEWKALLLPLRYESCNHAFISFLKELPKGAFLSGKKEWGKDSWGSDFYHPRQTYH